MTPNRPAKSFALSLACGVAWLVLSAAAQVPPTAHSEEDALHAFDLATTAPIPEILSKARAGEIAAQYAIVLVAQNGLQGHPVDLVVASRWQSKINATEPFEIDTVTHVRAPREGQPPQVRQVEIRVNAQARIFARAYNECVGEILGLRPNPGACGSTSELRDRRKAAWRSATAGPDTISPAQLESP